MKEPIKNLRIHLYGVQGSGSVFPRLEEREKAREAADQRLLRKVFDDLKARAGADGILDCRIEDILGGKVDPKTLRAYRDRLGLEPEISYGGWTTCIHVETADGSDFVFDCGSGFRNCAGDLQAKWGERPERTVHIFGSHSHRDHTSGFDQALVCFDPRNVIRIYGTEPFLSVFDRQSGIFTKGSAEKPLRLHTPLTYEEMPAQFFGTAFRWPQKDPPDQEAGLVGDSCLVGQPMEIGDARITTIELYHSAPCLGYCVEFGGKKFIFATDHERRHGDSPGDERQRLSLAAEDRLIKISMGADALYRDAQYLRSEYDGEKGIGQSAPLPRMDWGHSCIEDVQAMAEICEIGQSFLGHHDPNREWSERQWIDQSLTRNSGATGRRIELAKAETVIDL